MRLYKYRDLARPNAEEFRRLKVLLHRQAFWCARPDTLNDPEEFAWVCDYTATDETPALLARLLTQAQRRSLDDSRARAMETIATGRFETIVAPTIAKIIEKCRAEIGLVCFGSSSENPILWQRYGGNSAGVCVEIDVPDDLMESQLFAVQYPTHKVIHIDQLMRAVLDNGHVREVYSLSLLSKPSSWAPEAEIRFISKMQDVLVSIDRSRISGLILGHALEPAARTAIEHIVDTAPYPLPILAHVA